MSESKVKDLAMKSLSSLSLKKPLSYEESKNSEAPYLAIQHAMNGRLQEAVETIVDTINTTKLQLRKYYESQGCEQNGERTVFEQIINHESLAPLYDLYGTTLMSMIQICRGHLVDGTTKAKNNNSIKNDENKSDDSDHSGNATSVQQPTKEELLQWVTTAGSNLERARRIIKSMIQQQNKVALGGNQGDYFWMELGSIHERLGEFYKHNGSMPDAIASYVECLKIRERFLEIFDEKLAHANADLGDMYLLAFNHIVFDSPDENEQVVSAADIAANIEAESAAEKDSKGRHLKNGAVSDKFAMVDFNACDVPLDQYTIKAANHYLAAARSIASLIAIHCGADPSIIPPIAEINNTLPKLDNTKALGKTAGLDDEHPQKNGVVKLHDDLIVQVATMKEIHDIVKMLTIDGGSLNVVMELQDELDRLSTKIAQVSGHMQKDHGGSSSDDDEDSYDFEAQVDPSKTAAVASISNEEVTKKEDDEHPSKRLKKG